MNNYIWTDLFIERLKTLLDDKTYLFVMEGPARSAKTALAIAGFYFAVVDSEEQYHLIAGQSYETITRNLLDADVIGLLKAFNLKLERDKIGNTYIPIYTSKGKKIIRLAPYNDKSRWKSILGSSIGVAFVDEVNIADKQFVQELFARQAAVDKPKQIWTLNGDDPEHWIYKEFIDYSTILGDIPITTRALMEQHQTQLGKKDGYYYSHFKMSDNPVMTPEKIERFATIFPIDSFYYKTKYLGERGQQGEMLFLDYMSQDLLVDNKTIHNHYTIGVDVGETQALNVFVLIGWNQDYSRATILNEFHFVKVGYVEKTQKLKEWLRIITKYVPSKAIDGIFIDSAEQNFLADISNSIYNEFNIKVAPSYKYSIKERVDAIIIGFSTKRILIDKACRSVYEAYAKAVRDKDKIREDKNNEINDIMDATEYAIGRHLLKLMRGD
jgi:PBSX family phage terminase large subunit